jgi:diguanylate cyclase (GGDEF)-like protein
MNLSPSTLLLIVVVMAVANVLALLAVSARSRAHRARPFLEADGLISSSYADSGSGDSRSDSSDDWPVEGLPGSLTRWTDPGAGMPPGGGPVGGLGLPGAPRADQTETPGTEPFEYPAPTSLEQRYLRSDDAAEGSDLADDGSSDHLASDEDVDGDEFAIDASVEAAAGNEDRDGDDDTNGPRDEDLARNEDKNGRIEDEDRRIEDGGSDVDDESAAADFDAVPMASVVTPIPTASASTPRGRDPLTGMMDALAFEEALLHEDAREERYRRSATVIVFELDGLAKLVDRLGSDPGDRIEAALGDTITRLARRADYVARLDRGRYAVLLPETDEIAAINYVERIRRACDLWLESGAIAMRLAIGWASTGGDASLDGAVRTATDRMRVELRRNARLGADATEMTVDEEASGF